jgi:hypothetical protein
MTGLTFTSNSKCYSKHRKILKQIRQDTFRAHPIQLKMLQPTSMNQDNTWPAKMLKLLKLITVIQLES